MLLYLTSSLKNTGGIAAVHRRLYPELKSKNYYIFNNWYKRPINPLDLFRFLYFAYKSDKVVINTPLMKRALLRDIIFFIISKITCRYVLFVVHGGDLHTRSNLFDRFILKLLVKLNLYYIFLGNNCYSNSIYSLSSR